MSEKQKVYVAVVYDPYDGSSTEDEIGVFLSYDNAIEQLTSLRDGEPFCLNACLFEVAIGELGTGECIRFITWDYDHYYDGRGRVYSNPQVHDWPPPYSSGQHTDHYPSPKVPFVSPTFSYGNIDTSNLSIEPTDTGDQPQ